MRVISELTTLYVTSSSHTERVEIHVSQVLGLYRGISRNRQTSGVSGIPKVYRFFDIYLDIHEKSCFLDEEDESNFRVNDTLCDVVLSHGKS